MNKYKNALIARDILMREYKSFNEFEAAACIGFLDFNSKNDKIYLKKQIEDLIKILNTALDELGNEEDV